MSDYPMAGTLSLVATPIGNLQDMSARAQSALAQAEVVLAEDTRRARALFAALGMRSPRLLRADERALERGRVVRVAIQFLRAGKRVVFLTDAGTPAIADPGWRLVAAVRAAVPSASVEVVPGPSALTAALACAGVPTVPFVFLGFPPHRRGRASFLRAVAEEQRTVVLFESPHRLERTIAELAQHVPDRWAVLAHELTKVHESVHSGPLQSLAGALRQEEHLRGEWVLVLAPLGWTPPVPPSETYVA